MEDQKNVKKVRSPLSKSKDTPHMKKRNTFLGNIFRGGPNYTTQNRYDSVEKRLSYLNGQGDDAKNLRRNWQL